MHNKEPTVADDPATPEPTLAGASGALGDVQSEIDALVASERRLNLELATASQLGQQFGRTLSAAFVGLAVQGKSFGDVLSSLALSLSRLALGAAFKPLETAISSAFQSLIAAPSLFSGASIATPDAFPLSAGASLANAVNAAAQPSYADAGFAAAAGNGAMPTIVLNVTTPDAESFRRSETQVAAVLARAVGLGQRNL
jgi:hypothetical protein